MASYVPTKIDLTPKRHHGYAVLLFIMGTLFPPLAVAARFGIGKDFWLNLLLTICGYIPGHGHNFYIQNIRNNKNHARTPKWAQRYGLVDTSTIERHQRRSQWANRYKDRLPNSTLDDQPYAEGQEHASSVDLPSTESRPQRQPNGDLWRPEEEAYYNNDSNSGSSGRWHYPANFEDAAVPKRKKEKRVKKDRWARTEDAYSMSEEQGAKKRSKRKKKKDSRPSNVDDSVHSRDSTTDFPEDPEGGLYAESPARTNAPQGKTGDDIFDHQF
ncbi:putative proteolipid membrane potential modulator [Lyophyllum shimeji]|uniref:Proteolipid membrane potential modulator n=1 Tax=Lyophyllum shimeji TaxID=47721 RepID=A0A9P3PGG7_LYOSH|nr:putative proteolipid membrane potential modulator [Lyophyllum shimeji]